MNRNRTQQSDHQQGAAATVTSDFAILNNDENAEELLRNYADNWVALKNGEVVASASNAAELVKEVRALKIRGVVSQYVRRTAIS